MFLLNGQGKITVTAYTTTGGSFTLPIPERPDAYSVVVSYQGEDYPPRSIVDPRKPIKITISPPSAWLFQSIWDFVSSNVFLGAFLGFILGLVPPYRVSRQLFRAQIVQLQKIRTNIVHTDLQEAIKNRDAAACQDFAERLEESIKEFRQFDETKANLLPLYQFRKQRGIDSYWELASSVKIIDKVLHKILSHDWEFVFKNWFQWTDDKEDLDRFMSIWNNNELIKE